MTDKDRPQIKCPYCPVCGTPPEFIWESLAQCWCPNEDCEVFMWEPWKTAKENLDDVGEVKWVENGPDIPNSEEKSN